MTKPDHTRHCRVAPSAHQAAYEAARLVAKIICDSVAQRQVCNIALAGGTTPRMLYATLAEMVCDCDVPWGSVKVFFSDERDVPHDHLDSNFRAAQRTLLDYAPIPPQQIFPMPADADDLDEAAGTYESLIQDTVPPEEAGVPRFDLILLGVGADGHTASLFPGSPALNVADRLVVSYYVPSLGRSRMTFTLELINAARNVMMLITGSDKADVVAKIFGDNAASLPAGRVHPTDGQLYFMLDAAAARNTPMGS